MILRIMLVLRYEEKVGGITYSLSGSWEMNSVTYFRVDGMTPAAPFVLSILIRRKQTG
jgi:hypothetical protein